MSNEKRTEDMNDSELLQYLENDRRSKMQTIYDLTVENAQLKADRDVLQSEVTSLQSRLSKAEAAILTKADK